MLAGKGSLAACYVVKNKQVNMRVKNRQPIDRYPHFSIDGIGEKGTVVRISEGLICIRMDTCLPGCEEWNNEVQLSEYDLGCEYVVGVVLHSMQELFNYFFEPDS
jgi:hypothetical protein